ncbi:MAG TPA: FAD binding domain-containing protein, partial [Acidimicrobiia bacterium]
MRGFELYDAGTIQEAVALLKKFEGRPVKVLGGGSDLVGGVMKDWVSGKGMPIPEVLIDLTTIKELSAISVGGDGATIGATATLSDVIEHKDVA